MPSPIENKLTPDFRYNPAAKRYIDSGGRFVSQSTIRGALDATLDASKANIRSVSTQLVNGEITTAQWQTAVAQQVKNAHLASGSAARGGWAQMSQGDYGMIGNRLRKQYGFLQNFANEIESGKQPLNGNFMRRADMYSDAARGTHEDMRRRIHAESGYNEEARELGRADHCPDCVSWDVTSLGWVPIGTAPPLFSSVCRTNCHCNFIYRNTTTGEIGR